MRCRREREIDRMGVRYDADGAREALRGAAKDLLSIQRQLAVWLSRCSCITFSQLYSTSVFYRSMYGNTPAHIPYETTASRVTMAMFLILEFTSPRFTSPARGSPSATFKGSRSDRFSIILIATIGDTGVRRGASVTRALNQWCYSATVPVSAPVTAYV